MWTLQPPCSCRNDDDFLKIMHDCMYMNELSHNADTCWRACLYLLRPQPRELHAYICLCPHRLLNRCGRTARAVSAAFRGIVSRGSATTEITYTSRRLTLVCRDKPSTALWLLGSAAVVNVRLAGALAACVWHGDGRAGVKIERSRVAGHQRGVIKMQARSAAAPVYLIRGNATTLSTTRWLCRPRTHPVPWINFTSLPSLPASLLTNPHPRIVFATRAHARIHRSFHVVASAAQHAVWMETYTQYTRNVDIVQYMLWLFQR